MQILSSAFGYISKKVLLKPTQPFEIYDASAGSGKTFVLVKEYLKIILKAKNEGYYKNILAITFTNKAVAEMKERIIDALINFSQLDVMATPIEMTDQIMMETGLNLSEIKGQSKKILKHLLHHYANFNVETIDHFNHRLIRTFARDLKLSGNFEVSLDTPLLIAESVDQLIDHLGADSKITQLLVAFALQKTDDDRSWDISKDILKTAQLLHTENDADHISKLREKSLDDFVNFKNKLLNKKNSLSESIIKLAEETILIIDTSGVSHQDFSRGYLPKYFQILASGRFDINLNTKWQKELDEKPLYPDRVASKSPEISKLIDKMTSMLVSNFKASKKFVHQIGLVKSILKNITSLSVINLVSKELELIKKEKNILPISEFNSLINKEVKNQPTPYIYERMGERYNHFFIDEFQDTSLLQWENMIPLIENALSQLDRNEVPGSLLLVGDVKQSIYRWRGGLPEQFINLSSGNHPFQTKSRVNNLDTNWRSSREIIRFNNDFFTFAANYFHDPIHSDIYKKGSQQLEGNTVGGYVKIQFIESLHKKEADDIYARLVFETIVVLKKQGYKESDICILTRTKKDGILLGAYLMEHNISIVSSETLLLQSSPLVEGIVSAIQLGLFFNNDTIKVDLLNFLHKRFSIEEDKHSFFTKFLACSSSQFSKELQSYGIDFDLAFIHSVSLYECCEYCIRQFNLSNFVDAYVLGFLDLVFEFDLQPQVSKGLFFEEWEIIKDKAAISAGDNVNAVRLMTIHKAKGLEFPIVLFPYADILMHKGQDWVWFPINEEEYGFDEALVNFSQELINYGEAGETIYDSQRSISQLDNINLLYVAFTRAKEQLYIFSKKPKAITKEAPSNYNQLFRAYLNHTGRWHETQLSYEFGISKKISPPSDLLDSQEKIPVYISSTPEHHDIQFANAKAHQWNTEKKEAIIKGDILHSTMSRILHEEDLRYALEEIENSNILASQELEEIIHAVHLIVGHPSLNHLFKAQEKVITERDIITSSGELVRPDRLNFHDNGLVTVIDYKTGHQNKQHHGQINSYASAIEEMGYPISEKLLIYIYNREIVINKV